MLVTWLLLGTGFAICALFSFREVSTVLSISTENASILSGSAFTAGVPFFIAFEVVDSVLCEVVAGIVFEY